jgi:hypothetical protein
MQLLSSSNKADNNYAHDYHQFLVREDTSSTCTTLDDATAAFNTHTFTDGSVETNGFFARTISHGRCRIKTVTLAVCSAYLESCETSAYAPARVTLSTYFPVDTNSDIATHVHLSVKHAAFHASLDLSQQLHARGIAWDIKPFRKVEEEDATHHIAKTAELVLGVLDDHLDEATHDAWKLMKQGDDWLARLSSHAHFSWSEEHDDSDASTTDAAWIQKSPEGVTSSHWLQHQYKNGYWYARKATQLSTFEWTQTWWACAAEEQDKSNVEHSWTIDLQQALDLFALRYHVHGRMSRILETRSSLASLLWATVRTRVWDMNERPLYERRHTTRLASCLFGDKQEATEWWDDSYESANHSLALIKSCWQSLAWRNLPLCIPWPVLLSDMQPLLVSLPLAPLEMPYITHLEMPDTHLTYDGVTRYQKTWVATWNWFDKQYDAAIKSTGNIDRCTRDNRLTRLDILVSLPALGKKKPHVLTCSANQTVQEVESVATSSALISWPAQVKQICRVTSDMRIEIPGVVSFCLSLDVEHVSREEGGGVAVDAVEMVASAPPAIPWPGEIIWSRPALAQWLGDANPQDTRDIARHWFRVSKGDEVPHLVGLRASFSAGTHTFEASVHKTDASTCSISRSFGCHLLHLLLTRVLLGKIQQQTNCWTYRAWRIYYTFMSTCIYAILWCGWWMCQHAPVCLRNAALNKVWDSAAPSHEPILSGSEYLQHCLLFLHQRAGWLLGAQTRGGIFCTPTAPLEEAIASAHQIYAHMLKPLVGDQMIPFRDVPFPISGFLHTSRSTPQECLRHSSFRLVSDTFAVPFAADAGGGALHVVETVQRDPKSYGMKSMRQVFRKLDADEWLAFQSESQPPLLGDRTDLLLASIRDTLEGRQRGGGNKTAPNSSSSAAGSSGSTKVDIHTYTLGGAQGTSRSSRDTIDDRNRLVVHTRQGQVRTGHQIEFLHKLAVSTCAKRRLCMVRIAFHFDDTQVRGGTCGCALASTYPPIFPFHPASDAARLLEQP